MTSELIHPWIAQVVGVCLSFYLGESPRSAIEIEDDGASLHFNVIDFRDAAIVAEWGLGSLSDTAVLMDSNNQIDAIISQNSLTTLQVELESLKPVDGPKKHRIELLDFRLVFQYSTGDVRLHINRLRIDWNNGPLKYSPVKKLRNEKSLRPVLERARQKATKSRKTPNPNGPVCPVFRPEESVPSDRYQPDERQNSPANAMSSQKLFSQVPTDEHRTANLPSKPGRSLLRAPAELLQRLMPSSRSFLGIPSRDSLPRQDPESSAHKGSSQPISGDDRVANNFQQLGSLAPRLNDSRQGDAFASRIGNGSKGNTAYESCEPSGLSSRRVSTVPASDEDDDDANSIASQISRGDLNGATFHESNRLEVDSLTTQHPATQPLHAVERPSPRKRQRESVETQFQLADENARQESQEDSPLKKRQRIHTTQATFNQPSDVGKPAKDKSDASHAEAQSIKAEYINPDSAPIRSSRSNQVNPWEGLGMIPSNEVFIPKDQANLLEEKLWIPPLPNEQMPQGHVPPSLLRQWNSIAERRHRQAEEAKLIPEQLPTLTQDTVMSSDHDDSSSEGTPLDWEVTPEKSRFENRLPDSSPVRQPSFFGIKPVLSLGWNTTDRTTGHDDLGDVTGSDKGSNPQTKHAEASQSAPGTSAAEDFRTLEGNDADADKVLASAKASLNELRQGNANLDQSNHPLSLEGQAANQALELCEKSPTRFSSLEPAIQLNEDDSSDESDESIMDTSVPLGLGESWPDLTQSTQVEQDVASSGASLPGANGNHVQVAETPANNNSRLHGTKLSKQETELKPLHTQMPSSQANKTSSPSRVLNTYPYHGSYEKSQTSNEGLGPSSHPTGDGSPRVDVEGTQTENSSTNVPSQNATQSQEIVLDSSGPAHRHQNFPSSQQAVAEPLALMFASSNEPVSAQLNEQTQGLMEGYLSQDVPMVSSQVSTTGRFHVPVPDQDYSPSRSHTSLPLDNEPVSESSMDTQNTQSAALVARRLAHINNPEKVAQAREVYKRFCDDYPAYAGDFDHFIELCSRLQAVRADGKLRRSFLWDDFILMHLQQYSSHIEQRASRDPTTPNYEEYFLLNFTHPVHRKRSLAAHGVELAASQFIPTELIPVVANSQVQPDQAAAQAEATKFSLAITPARNSVDLHVEPNKEVALSSLPDTVGPYFVPSSPTNTIPIKVEGPSEDYNESRDDPIYSMEFDEPKDVKCILSSLEPSFEQPADTLHGVRNDADNDRLGEIEETDLEDTYHETASVELGDESFMSTTPAASSRAIPIPVVSPEIADEDENWFVSLRRMRPEGPVWSDDHNTPFKRYAEADQNVLADRLRRGGAKILLDDKGVIRRAIHRD